jgi:hypothetical protein
MITFVFVGFILPFDALIQFHHNPVGHLELPPWIIVIDGMRRRPNTFIRDRTKGSLLPVDQRGIGINVDGDAM